ncbi:MAG: hypothetical protein O2901_03600 [Verrucomicrobia bacterium]|nr:hypothetical protein [Verrucomicrobiota bacterium]
MTSRLHDSLSENLVQQLDLLRKTLLQAQGKDDAFLDADREYYRRMKHYLDQGHGECWMRHREMRDLVLGAYSHFESERYELGEIAVLPNHTHVIVRPLHGFELEEILHSWKSFTAKEINKHMNRTGPVWQKESHDRLIRDSPELLRTERYVRNNLLPREKRESGR